MAKMRVLPASWAGLPFSSGLALQHYLTAEDSLADAAAGEHTHWYVDLSQPTNRSDSWTVERLTTLRNEAARVGVTAIVHGNFRNPLACEDDNRRSEAIEEATREIQIAVALGGPIIFHPWAHYEGRPVPLDHDRSLVAFTEAITRLSSVAHERGVAIWLENLPRLTRGHKYETVFSRPEDYHYVLGRVPQVDMIFDVGHAHLNALKREEATFERLAGRVRAVCFSDNDGKKDQHGPLGTGTIDFNSILSQMWRMHWRGIVVLEVLEASPAHAASYLRKCWKRMLKGQSQ